MTKSYDRAYFDRWYRGGEHDSAALRRKVALCVAMVEYHLGRPLRSVLDVGCGEGLWRAPLRRLRPAVRYLGLDPSPYAVARFGRARNLALASFGDLAHLRPCAPADLVICSDVLHYLPRAELLRGLPGLADLCGGVAWLETYTRGDAIDGDHDGFHARPASFYRKAFDAVGFVQTGPHLWLPPARADRCAALERVAP